MDISSYTGLNRQDSSVTSALFKKQYKSIYSKIHEGMFWEKFFFFSTKTSIFFLQITVKDILLIKIAESVCRIEERTFNIISDDLEDG